MKCGCNLEECHLGTCARKATTRVSWGNTRPWSPIIRQVLCDECAPSYLEDWELIQEAPWTVAAEPL